ncbi:MAG TPA: hypothetical protein VGE57_06385 [Solimonas sp.]
MSWTNPRPAAMTPPVSGPLAIPGQGLDVVLRAQGVEAVGYARLLSQDGEVLWQWASTDRSDWTYAAASDGASRPQADARRAEWLARHYTGETEAPLAALERITAFDVDYPAVNRLLPVWRVRFERDDALTAYVHTGEDRLAALNDRRKSVLLLLFQTLHTWHWLDGVEGLRLSLIGLAVLSVLAMTMLGLSLVMFRRAPASAPPARRAHRWLAWLVWVPALMLGVSGLFHLLVQTPLRKSPPALPPAVAVSAMPTLSEAPQSLSLLALPDGSGLWRVQAHEQTRWIEAASGDALPLDESAVVARIAGLPLETSAELQKAFNAEYGFANKRLPVWRLEDGERRVFVDLASGQVAARTSAFDVLEQRSFSTLHKWEFLNPIGRGPRDGVLAFAALLLMVMAGVGLALRRRQRRVSL